MKVAIDMLRSVLVAVPLSFAAPHSGHIRIAEGFATFYGEAFEGMTTASGVSYDPGAFVAAHPTYPFGTVLCVTNVDNGGSVRVCVIDRGPAEGPQSEGVIIDLSRRAFQEIASLAEGRVRVQVKVLRGDEGLCSSTASNATSR